MGIMKPSATFTSLLVLTAFALIAASSSPMSDEDVVRLFVSGVSAGDIIKQIRSSDVAFDLSEDMLQELRLAGLPPAVIEAMIARQAELDSAAAPVVEETPAPDIALRIRINPAVAGKERKPLRVIDIIDGETHDRLRLRTASTSFTDMALFVACRTQDHVPNQWRGESPLGRDFISVPRHRMLHFDPGAEAVEPDGWKSLRKLNRRPDGSKPKILEMELAVEIKIELEPGVAHDLTLGIALRAEERYYLIASDDLDGVVLQEEGRVVDVVIRSGKELLSSSLKVAFDD
jgi:hypothetical protein